MRVDKPSFVTKNETFATKTELNTTNSIVDSSATKIDSLFNCFDNSGIAKRAAADANGNDIVNTYATKSALNTTNSNVTTLQGYFSSGIAKKATADGNGNNIVNTYATKTELSKKAYTAGYSENGEVKTYNRYSQKGYTGSSSTYWYYKIATLPQDNAGNYASLIVTGRIGGWEAGNMSSLNALIFNRGGDGIVAVDLAKSSSGNAYSLCDIVCYREDDNTTSVYLKCKGYFTFDINIETYQQGISLPTTISYVTSVSGTESAKLSSTSSRLEIYNGKVYVGGNELATNNNVVTNTNNISTNATNITTLQGYFSSGIAKKATADGNGNNIVNTYATKSALNITDSNVTTLQGYFSNGIAKKAAADGNGKGITTEYVHTRVDGGTSPEEMYSQIAHYTDDTKASVFISAENTMSRFGGNVYVSTDFTELYYGDGRDGCALKLTSTDATLQFVEGGTEYSIITTKDTATANDVGVIKAAAVRTSAITTTQGETTSGRYYGVELDKNGKAFVNVPWTDNNTTYSAGTGLSLSGTTFSANTSLGLINSSSANVFDIYRLNSSSYRLKIIRGSHTFTFSSATGFPGGSITFPSGASMPSSNYHVIAWSSAQGNVDVYQIKTFSKATTGFQIVTRSYSSTTSFSVEYLAICTV